MISPMELYQSKLSAVRELYVSKLSGAGLAVPSSVYQSGSAAATQFAGELAQAESRGAAVNPGPAPAGQPAANAAASDPCVSYTGGGYDALAELLSYNRSANSLPGYATGVNAAAAKPGVSFEKSGQYEQLVAEMAQKYGVPASLINAMIQAESSFNSDAVSSSGAQGLLQLMPRTAAGLGVENVFDAKQNIEGGVKYLRAQLDRFGDVRLALAAYNYGPARVESLGVQDANVLEQYCKMPSHLQKYVEKILCYEKQFAKGVS